MTESEKKKMVYRARLAQGLCGRCGGQKPEGRFYCDSCREKKNQRSREERAYFKTIGICPSCQKNKLFGSEKQCVECRAYRSGLKAKRSDEQRQRDNEYMRILHKRLYAERVEQGICTRCGKRNVEQGKKKCRICLNKDLEYYHGKHFNVTDYRREHGLCVRCGGELDRDGKICKACAEKSTPKTMHSKANHVWRKDNNSIFGR